jgi:polyphosphate kinase
LLERAKFLGIFTSNLDEFFMKRMAVLRQGPTETERALLRQLREKSLPMLLDQAGCSRQTLVPGLASYGVLLRRWDELTSRQQKEASAYYDLKYSDQTERQNPHP